MRTVRRWVHDLGLGIRLAVSGRGGLVRLGLIAIGVGTGVAVLLLAASLVNVDQARDARENGRILQSDEFGEYGGDGQEATLLAQHAGTVFRGEFIGGTLLEAVGPEPPVPPGIDRIPPPGEVYLSPTLADLLASPDGELLRPRFPWTVAGTIEKEGLVDPHELRYYAGAELSSREDGTPAAPPGGSDVLRVFGFGLEDGPRGVAAGRMLLALSGGLLLLIPVFVLVGAATRIAAAARERRLAALRLVGADAAQTRRIATGEALAGSVVGLVIGGGLFAAALPFVEQVTLFGYGAFQGDVEPSPFGVVLIALAVPALAVGAGIAALRHTVSQPLGASRQARPPRRRLWWRLAPLLTGSAVLAVLAGEGAEDPNQAVQLAVLGGLGLVGLSVPLLLPWLLQRTVGMLAGGPPSWQLAIRRLQLDSGTPARAAGGIAALLTAAVALQTLVATTLDLRPEDGDDSAVSVFAAGSTAASTAIPHLTELEGVRGVGMYLEATARRSDGEVFVSIISGDCAVLSAHAQLDGCAAGDAFVVGPGGPLAGEEVVFPRGGAGTVESSEAGRWTVPADARTAPVNEDGADGPSPSGKQTVLLAAPAMPSAVPADLVRTWASVEVDPSDRDVVERIRNALVSVAGVSVHAPSDPAGNDFTVQLRNALLAGSVIVLALAAASMLIVSVEQMRERRQQLAALAACGVPTRTLSASVFWQSLVPFLVAAASAATVGSVLAWLFLRVFEMPVAIDWNGIATLTAGCALAVVVVTALTLPSLRAITRPGSLHTE